MKLINNILVAIDFRASSESIISNSITFAKKFKAKVTLIHVLPKDISNKKVSSLVEKAAETKLEKINSLFQEAGIETKEPILKFGNYCDRIVFAAERIAASLIILGAGEKQKRNIFQLGTTAGRVIRKSSKPVFVIKNNQTLDIKNILCPVDFSDESSHALNNAIAIARLFEAKLTIFSVYNLFNQTITRIDPAEVNEQRKAEQKRELTAFLSQHNLADVDYTQKVTGGEPSEEILAAAKEYQSDLLLMGTTGKSGISRILMGSVAEKVTREVSCSFITSQKEDFLIFDFQSKAKDLEEHYTAAQKLTEKGFHEEAIGLYKVCLDFNFSHVPSLKGLAHAYQQLGNEEVAKKYQQMAHSVLEQFKS